jgi:hypothetical protein
MPQADTRIVASVLIPNAPRFVPKPCSPTSPHPGRLRRRVVVADITPANKYAEKITETLATPNTPPFSLNPSLLSDFVRRLSPASEKNPTIGTSPASVMRSSRCALTRRVSVRKHASRGAGWESNSSIPFCNSSPVSEGLSSFQLPIDAIDHLGRTRVRLRVSSTFYCVLGSPVTLVLNLAGVAPPRACSPVMLRCSFWKTPTTIVFTTSRGFD